MAVKFFQDISIAQQALVALAVLLDGRDASDYLAQDAEAGEILKEIAARLSKDELEMRLPLIGTLYREALIKLGEEHGK